MTTKTLHLNVIIMYAFIIQLVEATQYLLIDSSSIGKFYYSIDLKPFNKFKLSKVWVTDYSQK